MQRVWNILKSVTTELKYETEEERNKTWAKDCTTEEEQILSGTTDELFDLRGDEDAEGTTSDAAEFILDPATIGTRVNTESNSNEDDGGEEDDENDADVNEETTQPDREENVLIGQKRRMKVKRSKPNEKAWMDVFKVGKEGIMKKNITLTRIRRNSRKKRTADVKKDVYESVSVDRGDGETKATREAFDRLDVND